MGKDFCEQASEAVAKVIDDAVIQLIAEKRVVTCDSIYEMVALLAGGEPDLAVELALDVLGRRG